MLSLTFLSIGFHQAQDTTLLGLATDLRKGEVGHGSLGPEEDSAEERHRIRSVALVVTTSSEDRAFTSHGKPGSSGRKSST